MKESVCYGPSSIIFKDNTATQLSLRVLRYFSYNRVKKQPAR